MPSVIALSVLDQSPIRAGGTPAEALADTIALAKACDRMGYRRYWVAEHHASGGYAGTAPEILIGAIAAATRRPEDVVGLHLFQPQGRRAVPRP